MYENFKQKGFEILAFPCNQFEGQESGSEADIKKFVEKISMQNFLFFQKLK